MNAEPRTIACSLPPRPRRRAGCPPRPSDAVAPPPPGPLGRVPRVARLLALALRLEQLILASESYPSYTAPTPKGRPHRGGKGNCWTFLSQFIYERGWIDRFPIPTEGRG
jgi:hypothetical protein